MGTCCQHRSTGERQEPCSRRARKVASEIRRKLGESLSTLQKYNTPLEQATTPSLEALQAYTLGGKSGDFSTAIPFLRRAIQLDPGIFCAHGGFTDGLICAAQLVVSHSEIRIKLNGSSKKWIAVEKSPLLHRGCRPAMPQGMESSLVREVCCTFGGCSKDSPSFLRIPKRLSLARREHGSCRSPVLRCWPASPH